jgi:hypothetical protein
MATYDTTTNWLLRMLRGSNVISDIDAGFAALGADVDSKLTPWSAGLWADRPAATRAGQRYLVTDLGYEVVADGANWQLAGSVGIGEFVETLRTSDPPGGFLLLADGRSIARTSVSTTYSDIIGGTSTNITLPDHRGRGTIAPSNMGGPNQTGNTRVQASLGNVLGEERHTLTAAESGVNGSGTTGNPIAWAQLKYRRWFQNASVQVDVGGSGPTGNLNTATTQYDVEGSQNHGHPLNARPADASHNTVHPVVAVNRLIRVK